MKKFKYKIRLHTWEYFKTNHLILKNRNGEFRVMKNPNAMLTFINSDHAGKVFDATKEYPQPYIIYLPENISPWVTSSPEPLLSWMIDEVYTLETHPQYFV